MKSILIIAFLLIVSQIDLAQETETEISALTAQQLEDIAERDETAMEDDQYLQRLVYYRNHPINLNRTDPDELRELMMLDELHLIHFFQYRRLFGDLLSIYELQAIPGWDIETIRKLLPYITLTENAMPGENLWKQFRNGETNLLVRYSRTIISGAGATQSNNYLGSLFRLFFRYKYYYKNEWQMGLLGDKDAGEQFFKGRQRMGFDFYSFHFFMRNRGKLKALALGDFSVNMGQGLIHWQAMAFKKSANITAMKRQSPVLRPYHASGEFNFHRGLGLTLQKGQWQWTVFASYRRLTATLEKDSLTQTTSIASLPTSGYHRTGSELEKRNQASLISFGSSLRLKKDRMQVSLNMVGYEFSNSLKKEQDLYNLFATTGRRFGNLSLDYSYTFRNLHLFGELAVDERFHPAQLHGMLVSLDPRIDLSLLFRSLHRAYHSLFANAFTENTQPTNETGLYLALTLRPAMGWRIETYADIYRFPWLRYRLDVPGYGKDFQLQVVYSHRKRFEIYSRYRYDSETLNQHATDLPLNMIQIPVRQSWRNQLSVVFDGKWTFRNRVELVWFRPSPQATKQSGYLLNADLLYTSPSLPLSGGLRLQYFETQSFNTRIYAYENDVLYSFSAPSFSGKGFRWYFNARVNLNQLFHCRSKWKFNCWFRFAQSYQAAEYIGQQTEWKCQFTVSG